MQVKKNNKKKITLVELLCLVVILVTFLAMGIVSLSDFVVKTRENQKYIKERLSIKATKNYLKDNKFLKPAFIGESAIIKLEKLKSENYLKTNLKNSNNELCMKNSYVRVYKHAGSEYVYTPYIFCNSKNIYFESITEPIIDISFLKENNKELKDGKITLKDKFKIIISGGINTDGKYLDIDSYSFIVSSKIGTEKDFIENYNSSLINVNYENEVEVVKDFYDYVTDIRVEKVKLDVKVRNVAGGEKFYSLMINIT